MKMGYTTERLNNRKFLVTRQEPGEAESYQISMLSHNSIAPLLEFSVRSVDNSGYYYYDITGLQNLNSLGGDVLVSPESVLILCRALAELSDSMNEYFLDIDRVRTDPEHVFGTPALDRFLFLYDPDKSVSEDLYQDGLRKLFEFVLQHFDHTADRDDTVMVYDMYSRILKGTFDPAAYGRIQEEEPEEYEKTSKEQETREADIPQTAASSEDDGAVLPEPERKKNRKKRTDARKKSRIPFAAAAVLFGILSAGSAGLLMYPGFLPFERNSLILLGTCTVSAVAAAALARASAGVPRKAREKGLEKLEIEKITPDESEKKMKRKKSRKSRPEMSPDKPEDETEKLYHPATGEDGERALFGDETSPLPMVWNENEGDETGIYLDDGTGRVFEVESLPFIVGTNPVCDARLSDRTVSRRHLKLFRIGENMAVTDLGSTNGTTLNGQRLGPGESRMLTDGDVLGLGRGHLTVHILN